jgi:hypothetical protein
MNKTTFEVVISNPKTTEDYEIVAQYMTRSLYSIDFYTWGQLSEMHKFDDTTLAEYSKDEMFFMLRFNDKSTATYPCFKYRLEF